MRMRRVGTVAGRHVAPTIGPSRTPAGRGRATRGVGRRGGGSLGPGSDGSDRGRPADGGRCRGLTKPTSCGAPGRPACEPPSSGARARFEDTRCNDTPDSVHPARAAVVGGDSRGSRTPSSGRALPRPGVTRPGRGGVTHAGDSWKCGRFGPIGYFGLDQHASFSRGSAPTPRARGCGGKLPSAPSGRANDWRGIWSSWTPAAATGSPMDRAPPDRRAAVRPRAVRG